ncbi:tRNA (adenosine(37)-N6)-dimethylallyltransferase MiaA [Pelobium manganitolerans]|uniref:tRNA dimethylallyltransferase n=1 Tax=Pelobium manganitolerans TaxID=1842495 RepID=A0A419S2I2_9SPHI|nr:tRNA (adenosine(37)-N6)-dimethylallyltransferase MiaA [Pelobium manganitolerans]RKD13195.1 tRNA (adenosine(37)-N6)-dimethylallyltransferase MiaA [Pelobium manganitolerans]
MGKAKTLIAVVGPTAIGKTAMAIKLAQHFETEIISADSRQFFKEMSIGTAKPNAQELKAAKHHFIGAISVQDDYNVGDFEAQALVTLQHIFEKNKVAIMVGGSGLYVNAVLYGFDELPKAPAQVREGLNARLAEEGLPALQQDLQKLDPAYYAEVDLNNPQRVIRALEVCISTGKPFSSFRRQKQRRERDFEYILIGLNADREWLYQRINERVDLMMQDGLVEEVKSLQTFQHSNALKTVGYSEIFRYLNGEWTLAQAVDKLKQNTRNFAKRQITWFKKNEGIRWFNPQQFDEVVTFIESKLNDEKTEHG